VLECVVNVSEGTRLDVLDELAAAAGEALLDLHHDAGHNRAVLTLVGEAAVRDVARTAVARIDLGHHRGAHPRIGAVDVVPFVPLGSQPMADAVAARDRFAAWAGAELELPCFLYGPERGLPEVRRGAFAELSPDAGPARPHPTAGGCAVGARPLLVAFNLWLAEPDLAAAQAIARELRGPSVRALGLAVGHAVQVSLNLVDATAVGPDAAYDFVAARARIARSELVGLVPERVLAGIDPARWQQLDLSPERTIEARLERADYERRRRARD
jgi:glutamate formiminotransferase